MEEIDPAIKDLRGLGKPTLAVIIFLAGIHRDLFRQFVDSLVCRQRNIRIHEAQFWVSIMRMAEHGVSISPALCEEAEKRWSLAITELMAADIADEPEEVVAVITYTITYFNYYLKHNPARGSLCPQ